MKRLLDFLVFGLLASLMLACGGGGGSAGTPSGSASPTNFKVNAPESVTLALGQKATYTISGGLAPYLVSNSAPAVANAVVVGATVEVMPLTAGTAEVTVSPSGGGASQKITVTVSTSANPLQVQSPDTVTFSLGNSGSYALTGGMAPYRAVSSAPGVLTVSVTGSTLQATAVGVGTATVSIYDATSANPVQRTFSVVTTAAFFTSAPTTLSMGLGTSRSFSVSGGVAPYFVASGNTAVADASVSGGTLSIVAGTTNGSTNVVLRDSGGATPLNITVNVGTNAAFYSNAPTTLTIQGGATRTIVLGGGVAPYQVSSGNDNIVTAVLSGTVITLTGKNKGATSLTMTDNAGAAISVDVTVEQSGSYAVSSIELTTTPQSIPSGGGTEATITALVKGSSNVGVSGADIFFSADSGILLSPSAQTDASGIATVRLGVGSNKTNRDITVTARVGTLSKSIIVSVTGTKISAPSSLTLTKDVPLDATDPNTLITVLDSAGVPTPDVALVASRTGTSLGNLVGFSPSRTDLGGKSYLQYTPTVAGDEKLLISGAGVTSSPIFVSVSSLVFKFVDPSPKATDYKNVDTDIEFKVSFEGVTNPVGRAIAFSTTRGYLKRATGSVCDRDPIANPNADCGPSISVSTVANGSIGEASVYLNSRSAGVATVTAQVNRITGDPGAGSVGSLLIKSTQSVNLTGVTPNSLVLQINPGTVAPNSTGSTSNKSAVSAYVTDAVANPVSNVPVLFQLVADPSGGSLESGVVNTGPDGYARTSYISGTQSTATNGVTISANVNGSFPSDTKKLTVSGNALFINIGVGNNIQNLDASTYQKPFSVYVTDATGNAVVNQTVTLEIFPKQYRRGELFWNGTVWAYTEPPSGSATVTSWCANEDVNANGILEVGEDKNQDKLLTPGNVVFISPLTVKTDSSGVAAFNLIYGEQFAYWINSDITARATVSGTESKQVFPFVLTGLSEDYNKQDAPPAGVVSPFGKLSVTIGGSGSATTSCP